MFYAIGQLADQHQRDMRRDAAEAQRALDVRRSGHAAFDGDSKIRRRVFTRTRRASTQPAMDPSVVFTSDLSVAAAAWFTEYVPS